MNTILDKKEASKLIGAAKSPSYQKGGALASIYPTKKGGCGCKK